MAKARTLKNALQKIAEHGHHGATAKEIMPKDAPLVWPLPPTLFAASWYGEQCQPLCTGTIQARDQARAVCYRR